ncbi:MAG: hypothetical protein ACE5F6_08660, partial [Anaerolineae bacterium]
TQTTIPDTEPPIGSVVINRCTTTNQGAIYTTSPNVLLALSASDNQSSVTSYRTSVDGTNYSDWFNYTTAASANLGSSDGEKTIYVQFKDGAGNLSEVYTDTIILDTNAGSDYGLSVNDGALWTNTTAVSLTIPAQAGTAEMQVSNDGGFQDVEWEPYTLYKDWQITSFGSNVLPRTVYVRFRDVAGSTSSTFQDDIILDITAPVSEITEVRLSAAYGPDRSAISTKATGATVPIMVRWAGTDDLSGVKWYDIQVRTAEGAWADWLAQTTETAAVYQVKPGQVYYFQSRAQDNAGNWEEYPGGEGYRSIKIYTIRLPALLKTQRTR